MTDGLDQIRRTARVLELLNGSFMAHARGDMAECDRLLAEASEVDAVVVSAVQGGLILGEIPRPEEHPQEWAEYVLAARDDLIRAEREAGL